MARAIAVIGAGNIGTRHLQAAVKCNEDVQLFAVDPYLSAIEKSKEILFETGIIAPQRITYLTDIESLPSEIDVAIIAVSSQIRRQIVESLLSCSSVKYMILEKVLFPCEEDYYAAEELLQKCNVKAWVNCARRSWPYTKILKQYFEPGVSVSMSVQGNMWGLGCNTIHYIDLLAFLTECLEPVSVDINGLDEKIIASKRNGYVEFTGELKVQIGPHHLKLISSPGIFQGFTLDIESHACKCHISEAGSEGKNTITNLLSNQQRQELFEIPFQSNLTNHVISSLLQTGECPLTPYHDSVKLHIPMLRAFIRKMGNGSNYCNIT